MSGSFSLVTLVFCPFPMNDGIDMWNILERAVTSPSTPTTTAATTTAKRDMALYRSPEIYWVTWLLEWILFFRFMHQDQNQNQNSLLVTHQLTYIHQGQRMRGLFSRSHQWCESRDAILRRFSRGYSRCRECIPISNSFRKETMPISISPSIWDMKWFWMMVSSIPKRGFKAITWYVGLTF